MVSPASLHLRLPRSAAAPASLHDDTRGRSPAHLAPLSLVRVLSASGASPARSAVATMSTTSFLILCAPRLLHSFDWPYTRTGTDLSSFLRSLPSTSAAIIASFSSRNGLLPMAVCSSACGPFSFLSHLNVTPASHLLTCERLVFSIEPAHRTWFRAARPQSRALLHALVSLCDSLRPV